MKFSYLLLYTNFESKLILWLTISKNIILSNEDLHCDIVYIPSHWSKYAHDDPFLEIQREVENICPEVETSYFLAILILGLV